MKKQICEISRKASKNDTPKDLKSIAVTDFFECQKDMNSSAIKNSVLRSFSMKSICVVMELLIC